MCIPALSAALNVVEQQLLFALRETPAETDCSVSARVLESLGHATPAEQEKWLSQHRPSREGKRWFCTGDRWEYCASAPDEGRAEVLSSPMPARIVAASPVPIRAIVVKPLVPLRAGAKVARQVR